MKIYCTVAMRCAVSWADQAKFLDATLEIEEGGEVQYFRVTRVERYCVAESYKLGWLLERLPETVEGEQK